MSDIVERLRQRPWRSAAETDYEAKERRQREREEGADEITALRAEVDRLRAYALKAFTVVEFCCGEGLLLETPFYDCDDLLLEGVNLLNVETAEEARTALEGKP